MFRFLAIQVIRIYQKTISPDHGPLHRKGGDGFCRFYPSCSQYTLETIDKNGAILGIMIGAWRILRCNPWSRGGFNPSPDLKIPKIVRYI